MENVDTVYEVNESNSTYRFLTPRAFEEEYPMLYNAVQKWDATFLNIANVKERGAMVKVTPFREHYEGRS